MLEGTVAEPVVEQPIAEPPVIQEPVSPEPAAAVEPEPTKPHALEPGGERFQQVWARAKAAESRMQEEREGRIRAEAEAQVLRETRAAQPAKQDDKVLSWPELKQMVADNKISESDALEYREKAVRTQAVREAETNITNKFSQQSRDQRIDAEIGKYKDAIPDVNVQGTDERKKFDTEFRYQVEFAGMDPKSLTTQLAALRAVYGPPERAVQYAKTKGKGTPGAESYAETSGGGRGPAPAGKIWHDKLPAHEKAHYERMIERGRYGEPAKAWDNVKAEINEYNERKGLAKIG